MNPIMLLIDAATIIVCALAVSGCGQENQAVAPAPEPTVASAAAQPNVVALDPFPTEAPTQAPTATPTPNPTTVLNFIPQDITICDAFRNWDQNTTIINAYTGPIAAGTAYYSFRWDGAYIVTTAGGCGNGCVAPDQDLTRSDIHGVVCTISIRNGAFAGVTP